MASLNDFINPDLSAADVLHSNGYAEAAARGVMGAGGGALSIEQRRQRMDGPRTIGAYQYSDIGSRRNASKARTVDQKTGRVYDASNDTLNDRAQLSNRKPGSVAEPKVDRSIERRQRFIEPQARNHNPYA